MKYLILCLFLVGCSSQDPTETSEGEEQLIRKDIRAYCNDLSVIQPVKEFTKQHGKLLFNSGDNSEQIKCLPITPTFDQKVVYSVKLKNLKKGQVLTFVAYGELTNEYYGSVMIAWYSGLSQSATGVSDLDLSEARGFNIDASRHHDVFLDQGQIKLTKDYDEVYLNVYMYAAFNNLTLVPGLKVEQDYGRVYGQVE